MGARPPFATVSSLVRCVLTRPWIRREDDFLLLYCGNGNFTLAMAPMFRRVLATEVSKVSVAAARGKHRRQRRDVDVVRLSSEELTLALDPGKRYERLGDVDVHAYDLRTVLVDPPRAGMGPEVSALRLEVSPRRVHLVQPGDVAADVRTLSDTHEVKRFASFDQPHFDCARVRRRAHREARR